MALNLQDKQAIVAEVSEVAKGALSAVVADSRGVTVDKMTELRKAGREAGVYMRVVRNTLLRRAVEGTPFECLKDAFPSDVKIGDIIQRARAKYDTTRPSLRNFVLSHTDLMGSVSTPFAPIVNTATSLKPVRSFFYP